MTIDIATERTARGLKQSDLADLAGVHVRTLRRLEKGGEGVSDVMRERVLIALGLLRDSEASDRERTPKLLRPDPAEYETALSVVDAEARRSDVSDFFSPFMILGLAPIVLVGGLTVTSRLGGPAGLVSFAVGAVGIVTFVLLGVYLFDRRLLRVQGECRTVLRGISVGAVTAIDSRSMWLVRCNSSKAALQAACDSSACSVVVLGEPTMTGRKGDDRMSCREPLMKEIAAESGVATRTLQRFRRGERISQPSQRRIEHVMQEACRARAKGLSASDADPVLALRESYKTMPFELRSGLDGLFPIIGFFTLVTLIGLWAATYHDGTNSPTKDTLFAGAATATVVLFAVWYLLPAMRRRRSRAMDRARSCAEGVLAGIRSGRVRRLSSDDRAMIIHQVGEAALVRDLERSPVGVRVDPF